MSHRPGLFVLAAVLMVWSLTGTANAQSLRFQGNGSAAPDADRVKIRIDNPADNNAGPPADIGAGDFTIELWLRTAAGNNAGSVSCGATHFTWINGNTFFDRDRYNQDRAFGISLTQGRVTFGVSVGGSLYTLCGTSDLRNGQWHHVAVQRTASSGLLEIFVDGTRQASATGPGGDISYPDDGVPGSFCGAGSNQPCTNSDPFIVLGAEKHDAGTQFPSYSGWMAELRLSTVRRYTAATYTVPTAAFSSDGSTAALYHFSEGAGTNIIDSTPNNPSPGDLLAGGNPSGPVRSTDSPFSSAPPSSGGGGGGGGASDWLTLFVLLAGLAFMSGSSVFRRFQAI